MADEALRRMLAPAGAPAESRRRTLALDESQDVVAHEAPMAPDLDAR
jgi:hypothetical protein